ncbi:MAG: hypothetical protein Kow0099_15990 [Candidatus Abyssubacteria bacterium]
MRTLDSKELKELIVKCWMTHDGLWFYHCLQECGIDKTSRINQAAARAIGAVEVKRIMRALGKEKIETFEELVEFVLDGLDVIRGSFMDFTFDASSDNILRIRANRCFAYEGIKKMGAIEGYDCGIFARMAGWLDSLGIAYEIEPPLTGCLMHAQGECQREFRFSF